MVSISGPDCSCEKMILSKRVFAMIVTNYLTSMDNLSFGGEEVVTCY